MLLRRAGLAALGALAVAVAAAYAPSPARAASLLVKRLRGRAAAARARLRLRGRPGGAHARGRALAHGFPDWRPRRVVLVRHGESEGNVDDAIYRGTPDAEVALTARGRAQAERAGAALRRLLPDATRAAERGEQGCVQVVVSPYLRTRQTLEGLLRGWALPDGAVQPPRQDPRLREQEFSGGLQLDDGAMQRVKEDRKSEEWGSAKFFFRFPDGESGADVYDRSTQALDSIFRSWDKPPEPRATLIVAHGLLIRLLLMRYFKWTVDQFDGLRNPPNCGVVVLERTPTGHYELVHNRVAYREGDLMTCFTAEAGK